MKTWGGVEVYLHAFFTSALDGLELSASRSGSFTPGKGAPVPSGWVPQPVRSR